MHAAPDSIASELRALERLAPVIAASGGEGVYLVGGIVRDILLGRPSLDVDLVVEGDATAVAHRLTAVLGGELTTHDRFGTAVVDRGDGSHVDVASARRETYAEPAALPAVEPGTIEDDLRRRDFTINAIAASLAPDAFGTLVDPTGGRRDLANGTIRVLHDRSFVDDPTRIYRAVRYEVRLGFRMEERTERLARDGVAGIRLLSADRLREEVVALLAEDDAEEALVRLADLGAAPRLEPGLIGRLDAVRAELDPDAPRWRVRLTPLVAADPALLHRLALSRRDARRVDDAVALAPMLAVATDPVEIAEAAGRAPEAALLALAHHDSAALRTWFTTLRNVRLEVDGTDLAALGLAESPRVGEVLVELRRRKLRGELDGREAELAAARELIGE